MSHALAKKYVNALVQGCNDNELEEVYQALMHLSQAYKVEKFNTIILSPNISKLDKETFVLSLLKTTDSKFVNFIKFLNSNDRLKYVPLIVKELAYQRALKSNTFEGTISTNFTMSEAQIKMLEDNFSKKFTAKIQLKNVLNAYPGIKVEIDDLGVEVSFSVERLKAQMSEHILKAI
ncbi:F0F1 ATP synthase subunit delta [Sulfurospirillum barnesii]|uniref:ATP synthase subunit delta n=1 Tax=Sulfurospirillum barnesii (strain ATCC 700032 / DSM 10660 / SES-3) TaxID=760154 RepID=I3XVA3_SULBS|nr:F0F1 ATP synthase subunit delta [Sulfurospirillum barnesii]AFL67877.1 F0F1-type ATP synthase delta subunit [Sulfurospirillum barnesii SES-3]